MIGGFPNLAAIWSPNPHGISPLSNSPFRHAPCMGAAASTRRLEQHRWNPLFHPHTFSQQRHLLPNFLASSLRPNVSASQRQPWLRASWYGELLWWREIEAHGLLLFPSPCRLRCVMFLGHFHGEEFSLAVENGYSSKMDRFAVS